MIIVTGGAGFIGSAFVWQLNRMGREDILVVDNLGEAEKWQNLVNLTYQDYLHKDAYIEMVLDGQPPKPEAIVHMGACSSTTEPDADYLYDNNVRYSKALCRHALEEGARFIYASSAATYGGGEHGFSDDPGLIPRLRPLNMYGYSKQLFDQWLLREGLIDQVVGLKYFNVFGPNEYHKGEMKSLVCKAHTQIVETGKLKLFKSHRFEFGHGEQQRDFVYVKDCLESMAWLLEHPEVTGVFNLGFGRAHTWNDLAKAVFAAMGQEPVVEYIDMPESIRDKYQYFTCAHMDRLKATGCPVPETPLEEAVSDYVAHLQKGDPYLGAP